MTNNFGMDPADIAARKQEVHDAMRVAEFLHDPLIERILNGLIHSTQNEWITTADRDRREYLWTRVQGVQEFAQALQSIVETGKLAAAQLEADAAMKGEQDGQD